MSGGPGRTPNGILIEAAVSCGLAAVAFGCIIGWMVWITYS